MRPNDRKKFLLEMAKMKVTFPPAKLTEDEEALRAEVYWEELAPYSIESVALAMRKARGTMKYFPTPSDLKALISDIANEGYLAKSGKLLEGKSERRIPQEQAKQFLEQIFSKLQEQENAERQKKIIEFEEKRRKAKEIAQSVLTKEVAND